ncbi:MAG: polysaccharide deacetylase [Oscillospiraceae bacterium]|nr:polysaccharide deacetylase [Oscillospiraceae bacterium]
MRFGSVEFFKVLIKTVLAIFFFVPLAAAIVFAVLFFGGKKELDETKAENERLNSDISVLVGDRAGTAESFYDIFEKSGVSYSDLIKEINKNKKLSSEDFYKILSEAGISDKDIVNIIVKKNSVGAWELYEIMSNNGISDTDLIRVIVARNSATAEECYEILAAAGMTDKEILDYINKKNGISSSSPSSSSSVPDDDPEPPVVENPYAALYPDMFVTAPRSYVREDNTIYLTFDDGPSSNTENILHYLKMYNIKATFFVVPQKNDTCYKRMKAIVDAGHSIGVHSASHVYTDIYSSVEAYLEDFYTAREMIYEATGVKTEIFRFPGGSVNDYNEGVRGAIIEEMTRRGFRYYDWSVDSLDAEGANWTTMYNHVLSEVANNYDKKFRSVVLMHDASERTNTVFVLEDIIKVLVNSKDRKYKFDKINNDTTPVQFTGPFA